MTQIEVSSLTNDDAVVFGLADVFIAMKIIVLLWFPFVVTHKN